MLNILGTCLFSVAWLLLSLGIIIRLLPRLFKLVRHLIRGILIVSYRLYAMILSPVAPVLEQRLGINILAGFSRVIATSFLSLLFGLPLVWLATGSVLGFASMLLIIHGLVVGVVWKEIEEPGDLQLGAKIK